MSASLFKQKEKLLDLEIYMIGVELMKCLIFCFLIEIIFNKYSHKMSWRIIPDIHITPKEEALALTMYKITAGNLPHIHTCSTEPILPQCDQ